MTTRPLEVIILAAGQGTRMKSARPKVLHPLAGRPMLAHVLDAAQALAPERLHVVYGHGGEAVRQTIGPREIAWVEQAQQLGTGHAVQQAIPGVGDDATVLVLYGDVPLVQSATLADLVSEARDGVALLTVELDNPAGYGRIVRDREGSVQRIVEEKDANDSERSINEVNTGIMAAPARQLKSWLQRLRSDNAQGEYYLTDVIGFAVADGLAVEAVRCGCADDVLGVNDRAQLAHLERVFQRRQADALMRAGVTLIDPARLDVRGQIETGQDVVIEPNVVLNGRVVLGNGVVVGANCVLTDVVLGDGAQVLPMSVLEGAEVGPGCHVGPFARLRPGTRLADGARVGNFVEVKNSAIGAGSKINHLSYVGDTGMGQNVNVGAGTITCNYDGARKHRTTIGDNVFIGSDTQLVAPVTVGDGATIGAGSTITRDAPPDSLSLSRSKQRTIDGWERPTKDQR